MTRRTLFQQSIVALAAPFAAFGASYTCLMDPDVRSTKPGKCPKCGMDLRLASEGVSSTAGGPEQPTQEGRIDRMAIPDTVVYDQDSHRLKFYTDLVKGKTVAINFLFTTCTTICPPLAATFRKVQQGLGPRIGKDIALISVSVDPTVDIPERLKSFGEKFHAGPGWTLVTGNKSDIDKLLEALGAAVANKTDHTPMILIGNDTAQYWTRAYGLAHADKLIDVISDAAARR